MKEQYYYKTIKSLADKKISKQGAATRLNISIRHVNRLLNKHKSSNENINVDEYRQIIN